MALPAHDHFTGTPNTPILTYSANWTGTNYDPTFGGAIIANNAASIRAFSASTVSFFYWNADSFDADQYGQIVITVGNGGTLIAIFLRAQSAAASGYTIRTDGYITRVDNYSGFSGETVLASGFATTVNGDLLYGKVAGLNGAEVLTRKINGVTQGTYTGDGTYDAGSVGVEFFGNLLEATDWEGGNLAGPPQPPIVPPGDLTSAIPIGFARHW